MIVMITKLVEKNKRKAHQYWPEDVGEDPLGLVLDLGGGCRVEFISSSYQGSYFLRQAKFLFLTPPKDILRLAPRRWCAKSDPATH